MTVPMDGATQPPLNSATTARYLLRSIGKWDVAKLTGVVTLMSLLDMAGVAVIFPFLSLVTQPDAAARFASRFDFLAGLPHRQLVLLLGVGLAVFYTAKTWIMAALMRFQARVLSRFTAHTTNDVISRVLEARYAVFQQTAASEIGGVAYSSTVHATLALAALIQAANEGLVLLMLLVGFLLFEPMVAIAALVFALVAALLLYRVVIRRSAQIGSAQSRIENARYRLMFSLASAIRDIKIMGVGDLFDARSRNVSAEYADLAARYSYNIALPRLLIEFFALLAIVGVSLAVVLIDMPSERAGPLLGLIAVATVRAVPAFYRFFSSASAFRASQPIVARMVALVDRLGEAAVARHDDDLKFERSMELRNIEFHYGGKKVLDDVSLELRRGEAIGIVGSSGAGKTTLLDLFTGLQPATAGQFLCDGVPFDPFGSRGLQRLIGYVPQAIALFDDTIAFNVSFEANPNLERVAEVLAIANLKSFISSLQDGVATRVGENGVRLSGGQRQRIGIARALYHAPKILVFDEATSSLDTVSERELTAEIERLHGKISVLIVAHRLSTVMSCDRIYVLAEGAVVSSGSHAELLAESEIYRNLYASQGAAEVPSAASENA